MAAPLTIATPRSTHSDDGEYLSRRITTEGRWENALRKAREIKHKVWKVEEGRYRVHSASNAQEWHYIRRDAQGEWGCDCQAAQYGQPCWHVAALGLRLQREYRAPRLSDLPERGGDLFSEEEVEAVASSQEARKRPRLEDLFED